MKKILVIGMSSTLGGVETYLYNLVKNLDREMYNFDFLVIGKEKSIFEEEINFLMGDRKNHFFYCPNLKSDYFAARKWLKNFYDNNRYDFIYLNTCTAAKIKYCEYTAKKNGTSIIAHSHSGNATNKIHILSNWLYRKKITKLSKVRLACSELAYSWLFSDVQTNNCIIPNGVDIKRFYYNPIWRSAIRTKLNIQENDKVIGNVGRLSPQKNQFFLIELCKNLDDNYKVLIIGDGELKEELIERIRAEKLESRFIILPAQRDIEKYYSAMDIFAMPSNFEGLPIVGIEAQAEGLPCILSTNISIQTSLGKYCKFLSLDDIHEWKNLINELIGIRYDGTALVKEKGFDNLKPVNLINKIFTTM